MGVVWFWTKLLAGRGIPMGMITIVLIAEEELPVGLTLDLDPVADLRGLAEFLNRVVDGLEELCRLRPDVWADYQSVFGALCRARSG